jgi:undecaprenyl-phosphate 4-deoxy-4-formamido-L-arabinose transferase
LILPLLVQRLEPVLAACASQAELVLVNDGSEDRSWDVIRDLAQRHAWIRGICLMRNYGQHNALLCGIRAARYDVIITMDDDLQHPPEEIPKLLRTLEEGYDVVYGVPQSEAHDFWRRVASSVIKLALRGAMGVRVARSVSAFRAFRSRVRDAFGEYRGPFVCIDVLLSWGTTRFAAVPVAHHPRALGTSTYTFGKLIAHALNMLTGFSVLPLRLASGIGFGFVLFGIGILAYVLIRYLTLGTSVPGFPFLASALAIFSGVQLFVLGIIGEYLARMYFRMMERPTSVVRETIGFEGEASYERSAALRSTLPS